MLSNEPSCLSIAVMVLRVLCVGDVVGPAGRQALRQALEAWKPQGRYDCVIVNAENAANGAGLTPPLYDKIIRYGADLITLGDHVYKRNEIIPVLEKSDRIVKPANLPQSAPGKEFAVCTLGSGARVAVISLLGRMYMKQPVNCPFATVDRVLANIPKDVRTIVVDVHAEATSEKVAMGWHLNGRVSAVFGTHTHVPTADECVLSKGTAYVTDLGMTGPYDSVLGRVKEYVLSTMINGVPRTLDVASGDPRLYGVIVSVDTNTGRATGIERVRFDAQPGVMNDQH